MKKIYLFFLVIISSFGHSFAEDKLSIGVVLPLTGLASEYGEAFNNGLQTGLSEQPGIARLINLKIENHQYDSKLAITSVRKLASLDNVDLIYVWGYTPSDAVAPIAAQLSKPILLASLNPVSLNRKNVINLENSLETTAQPLIDEIRSAKIQKIALVASQVGVLVQFTEIIKKNLSSVINIASDDVFLPENTDFRSLITRLKKDRVDAVALLLAPEQIRMFVEQALNFNYQPQYYGGNTFNTETSMKLFAKEANGPIFVDSFSDNHFSGSYKAHFKKSSHIVEAAKGYFLAELFLYLARNRNDRLSIIDTISRLPPGSGPAGSYRLINDPDFGLHVEFSTILYQLRNGRIEIR